MIRINLLPHRELRRKARQQLIVVLAGLVGLLAIVVVMSIQTIGAGKIDYQNGRNQYLTDQIAILDTEIAEIAEIKAQTKELIARKQVVETFRMAYIYRVSNKTIITLL